MTWPSMAAAAAAVTVTMAAIPEDPQMSLSHSFSFCVCVCVRLMYVHNSLYLSVEWIDCVSFCWLQWIESSETIANTLDWRWWLDWFGNIFGESWNCCLNNRNDDNNIANVSHNSHNLACSNSVSRCEHSDCGQPQCGVVKLDGETGYIIWFDLETSN